MSTEAIFVEPIEITTGGALTTTNVGTSLDPAAWNSGTTYALADQATSGEVIYQSVQAGNLNHAVSDTAWWVEVGAINKMRMFDRKIGAQTENADTIEVDITPGVIIDVVSVRNVQAASVTVEQSTVADGVIYSRTVELDEPVVDWFDYWFSAVTMQTEALFTGILPYSDAVFNIVVDNTGGTSKCGELLMGPALEIGRVMAGVSDGIDDYSRIEADEFGVRDIVERDFADNMEFAVRVEASISPVLKAFLTRNRAQPFLVLVSPNRPDAQVYGLAESWRRVLSYVDHDTYSITMRGLT
jgi:hypothetical protein